jgi:HD-GYP domain-containing protein (c-di-GMP phosphodiesterase class II)
MTDDAALAELEAGAGTQFDPRVVTAFARVLRDEHAAEVTTAAL